MNNKEEDQRDRQDCVDPWSPEFARRARGQVREKDPRESGGQGHVRLEAELPHVAHQTVFKENQAEHGPADRNGDRLQLIPHQQRDQRRCGP